MMHRNILYPKSIVLDKKFSIFYRKTHEKRDLQQSLSSYAANMQQICYKSKFFAHLIPTNSSRVVPKTYPWNLVTFHAYNLEKYGFLHILHICGKNAAICSNLGIFSRCTRSGCVQLAKLHHCPKFQKLLQICSQQANIDNFPPDNNRWFDKAKNLTGTNK